MSAVFGWAPAIAAFLEHLRASDRKWATSKQYAQHVGWLGESAPCGPWEITSAQLSHWLDERGWSVSTRRKVLVSLRAFYAWAVTTEHVEWSPMAGLPSSAVMKRGPERRPLPPPWQMELDAFIAWLRAGSRAENTILLRVEHLRHLSQMCLSPWSVSTDQLALYLSSPDWSPETRRSRRSTLRMFYKWGVIVGRIEVSPAADLPSVIVPRALPRPTPDDAIRAALWAADDRTRLAMMLGAFAGLRRAEIAQLHTSEIGADQIFVHGKGGHHRRVPLHPDLGLALTAELSRRARGEHGSGWRGRFVSAPGYLFPSDLHPGPCTPAHIGKIVSTGLQPGWTAHTLRHRFATSAYAVERDLRAVQELLGHSKPESTARYAAVPEGAKRSAVDGVGLRW